MRKADGTQVSPAAEQKKDHAALTEAEELRYGNRVVTITIIINLALTLLKLLAGILGSSMAMVSDAVHSASDMIISVFVLIGLRIARKHADEEHPYGHERMESLVSILMSVLLAVVALSIGFGALRSLLGQAAHSTPGALALTAAAISIVIKEWMYHYTKRAARRINSPSLEADAWHHRADAFSSVGSLIGIGGAMLGWRFMDPVAALVICLLILKVAFDLSKNALDQMLDKAAPPQVIKQIEALIAAEADIIRLDDLKTRQHGSKLYVDVEIAVAYDLSLTEAHNIAERLHDKIEAGIDKVKHCMVHVNPDDRSQRPEARN
jgi:cation diffusion facilitator family transporter